MLYSQHRLWNALLGRGVVLTCIRKIRIFLSEQIAKKTIHFRLSVLAGHKMTAGNPYIADLSDAYRPTNIAEQFRQVYDDEWTHAYEDLEKHDSHDETVIIDILLNMLKVII